MSNSDPGAEEQGFFRALEGDTLSLVPVQDESTEISAEEGEIQLLFARRIRFAPYAGSGLDGKDATPFDLGLIFCLETASLGRAIFYHYRTSTQLISAISPTDAKRINAVMDTLFRMGPTFCGKRDLALTVDQLLDKLVFGRSIQLVPYGFELSAHTAPLRQLMGNPSVRFVGLLNRGVDHCGMISGIEEEH